MILQISTHKTSKQTHYWENTEESRITLTKASPHYWRMRNTTYTQQSLKTLRVPSEFLSISLVTTVQPPTIAPAPAMAAPAVVPSEDPRNNPTVAPIQVLSPPKHVTAQNPNSSEESAESVEPIAPLRRSEKVQDQNQNRYQNFKIFEAAGQHVRKMQSSIRTSQGEKK